MCVLLAVRFIDMKSAVTTDYESLVTPVEPSLIFSKSCHGTVRRAQITLSDAKCRSQGKALLELVTYRISREYSARNVELWFSTPTPGASIARRTGTQSLQSQTSSNVLSGSWISQA